MRTVDSRHADDTEAATHDTTWPSRRWVLSLVFGGCLVVDLLLLALIVLAWEDITSFFSSVVFGAVLPVRTYSYIQDA